MSDNKMNEFAFLEDFSTELSNKKLIFPTSVAATMKIRKALSQLDISNDLIARIIGSEPVLSAKVLHLSNTAAFNPQARPISDLRAATMLLGFAAVRNVAIAVGMKQLAENKFNGNLATQMDGLWRRSLRVAALSMVIARTHTKLSADKAMLAGLLHDIGKFYILNRAHHFQALFTTDKILWDLIDQWHASIGSAILEDWDISEDIRNAVLNHRGYIPGRGVKANLTDVLATADFLDAHFVAENIDQLDWAAVPPSLLLLGVNQENIEKLLQDTRVELTMVMKAIS
ncbi:HDOD domain-containing protein [Undibacterium sp. Dicai25W]|uniref:HDOD domain-containing protein n=1 Tax=Undibacterium sp. Dicai25W TaxID=3413034 RepID=UPI003BF44BD6